MAAASVQEASPAMARCPYHVFLSFRGADTRHNFTDHLYAALVQAGIHTFRDDDEIERGKDISDELQRAIRESRISIVVFSKNYVSSRWCLDELVMIMGRRRSSGHIVIPVFYHVDPSHVKKQTGIFAKAFAIHEVRFKEEMERVEGWRAALREVAELAGMVPENRPESNFIQDIVKEISYKLDLRLLDVTPYLVGADRLVKDINSWLRDGSNNVGIATIYGIGGIGKTTIAKIVYNQNFGKFECRSFLGNVRENSAQFRGLIHLQKQLLSDLLKKKVKINNVDEGIVKIQDAVCCRRVFLVLDDVDDLDQLNAIYRSRAWFYPGSKIIITTRHEQLLSLHDDCKKFKVSELNHTRSLQLFSWHAFGQNYPVESHKEYSTSIVKHCGGLPLALQVLGSSLSKKKIDRWEDALQKFEMMGVGKIQKSLRISYDALDDHNKSLFLDIACFFTGKNKDYVAKVLRGCGVYAEDGIQELRDGCLLFVDAKNKLGMHQLLRDMGREIVRQESPEDPGKRSRLWRDMDAFNVLTDKTGMETVRGLTIDMHRLKGLVKSWKEREKVSQTKRHRWQDSYDDFALCGEGSSSKRQHLGFFSWKPAVPIAASTSLFPTKNELELEADALGNMRKMKLLQLNYVKLTGNYKEFPKSLVWLCWRGFALESLPPELCLDKIIALDLRNSQLKHNWKGGKVLKHLKILNLSHAHCLKRNPDFSGLTSLEILILKDCVNLVEVDESIQDLQGLLLLNLKGCKNLRKLSREIGMLKSLQELNLSGCLNLEELPEELRNLKSLRILNANATVINQPKPVRNSRLSLVHSWIFRPRTTQSSSFSFTSLPRSLVKLSLDNCNLLDDAIPNDISSLSSLQFLSIKGNPVSTLPESIKSLTMLRDLSIECCSELKSLPELPMSLNCLSANHCTSLERITNLPNIYTNLVFRLFGCEKLVEVQGLFKLETVTNTDVEMINNLGLFYLESIEGLEVEMVDRFIGQRRKAPLQVLHESGISSIFLPGSEIPNWFGYRSTKSSICLELAPLIGHKFCGLNLCVCYEEAASLSYSSFYYKITIETKSTKWTYVPSFTGSLKTSKNMLWLSHWKFGDMLKSSEQVKVSVDMKGCKGLGIHVAYELEDESIRMLQNASSWSQTLTLVNENESTHLLGAASYIQRSGLSRLWRLSLSGLGLRWRSAMSKIVRSFSILEGTAY